MKKFVYRLFKTKVQPVSEQEQNKDSKTKPDFIKQYTLFDPKKVMVTYSAFSNCSTIPVAYESNVFKGIFAQCFQMPNQEPFVNYLKQLSNAKPEVAASHKKRTISVIELDKDKNIFILPNLEHKKTLSIVVSFKDGNTESWPLFMTPEINRAIVEQLKFYTR